MDPIAQMLNQIKNAQAVGKESVSLDFSNFKQAVAKILEESHFVSKVEKKGRGPKKTLEISLRYEDGQPIFTNFKKISKPGRRIFSPVKNIKTSHSGQGIVIVSTPKGLMTGSGARKSKLGGEVIAEVW
ncbi:MAG: 30S ribosomal protein S8 [bacterium]|nr:30S ribosomal protein S8 [bacterium]